MKEGGDSVADRLAPQKRYNAMNMRRIILDINAKTHPLMLKHLLSQPNKQAYIKKLILKDMIANGIPADAIDTVKIP